LGYIVRAIQKSFTKTTSEQEFFRLLEQRSINESVEYALINFTHALFFQARKNLWDYCIEKASSILTENKMVILEFGVYKGASINYFARKCPEAYIYGFDSFEGLEENWYGYMFTKGQFNNYGKLPKCEKNVELLKGWYTDTLPSFIDNFKDTQIQILHMDSDTYKATSYVLNAVAKKLQKGTIVIFDEYFGYTGWKLHEYKAWQEFTNSNGIKFQYIAYTNCQVAIEIL